MELISIKTTYLTLFFFVMGGAVSAQDMNRVKNEVNKYENEIHEKLLNKYQDSILIKTKEIEKRPKDVILYTDRAQFKFYIWDYYGAIDDYTTALSFWPNCATLYFLRGDVKFFQKEYMNAISDFTQAIKIDPNSRPHYFSERGDSKLELEDYRGAYLDYSKAIELYSSLKLEQDYALGEIYYERGWIQVYYLENKESGCLDLSKAGELGYSLAYYDIKNKCN
ncbi:MAG: hypothetical protein ABJC12_09755 [Saprospiraceae bacterium]